MLNALLDVLVVLIAAMVLVLVAYVTSEWSWPYAAAVMGLTGGLVVLALMLHWRVPPTTPLDQPQQVADALGTLSGPAVFTGSVPTMTEEQRRAELKRRLTLVSPTPRGPARLERVK